MYKLYTLVLESYVNKRLREQKGQIKNGQSSDTDNIWHKTQNEDKQSKKKTSTL
jgi:hypothetical protein